MMDTYFFPDDPLGRIRDDIARVAGYLWEKGWAERNAGNMSVNITGLEKIDLDRIKNNTVHKLGNSYPNLAGQVILLTGTGTRMRDIAIDPQPYICKIRLLDSGNAFQQLCDYGDEGKVWPTSELPTHLLIHDMLVGRKAPEKTILHTHVNELIALTQIREFTNAETLNNLLWSMHPETVFFIPEGAGLVPYALPGTNQMAME
ncbi:MAG: class II aldolase/adducin family protein, partial [Bacteroidetes bacterium]|nr:class II aldolase/adducin family protein [Bacteroidota bacterium]